MDTLTFIKSQEFYQEQIIAVKTTLERASVDAPRLESSTAVLSRLGINNLYSHQYEALTLLEEGKNVIVSTSTSSGKSLIYLVRLYNTIIEHNNHRVLLIFPTKALAQDQIQKIRKLFIEHPAVEVAIYDGDTPSSQRATIRQRARIILTNPDMIHFGLLRHHEHWRPFFQNLKLVVVDELHYYSGKFGTHASYIFRRFLRLLDFYGNISCQFICCSATLGHAKEHMHQLIPVDDIALVDKDGSPLGKKHYLVWSMLLI